jgi:hypothetical protein
VDGPVISYAGVQALFRGLGKDGKTAPHENFWELPWAQFVTLRFPDYDDGGTIRMVVPGDSRASNLIRALKDGRGIEVDLGDGNTLVKDIARMPKQAEPMKDEDIAKIARWIDAGCPEQGIR